mgnify:CR=1 FL=1
MDMMVDLGDEVVRHLMVVRGNVMRIAYGMRETACESLRDVALIGNAMQGVIDAIDSEIEERMVNNKQRKGEPSHE